MSGVRRVQLDSIHQHVTCGLCSGYLVEATNIIECLHSFCRSCIVTHLENCTTCPTCEIQTHKVNPLLSLRKDPILQSLVYKLVPGLYKNEMDKRDDFYTENFEDAESEADEHFETERKYYFHSCDQISLSLEYLPPAYVHSHVLSLKPVRSPHPTNSPEVMDKSLSPGALSPLGTPEKSFLEMNGDVFNYDKLPHKRYLKCPAAIKISHLEKFVRIKYSLALHHRVDLVHKGDCLDRDMTLMDVLYQYKYTEDAPLRLFYTVVVCPYTRIPKKRPRPIYRIESPSKKCDYTPCKKSRVEDTPVEDYLSAKRINNNDTCFRSKMKEVCQITNNCDNSKSDCDTPSPRSDYPTRAKKNKSSELPSDRPSRRESSRRSGSSESSRSSRSQKSPEVVPKLIIPIPSPKSSKHNLTNDSTPKVPPLRIKIPKNCDFQTTKTKERKKSKSGSSSKRLPSPVVDEIPELPVETPEAPNILLSNPALASYLTYVQQILALSQSTNLMTTNPQTSPMPIDLSKRKSAETVEETNSTVSSAAAPSISFTPEVTITKVSGKSSTSYHINDLNKDGSKDILNTICQSSNNITDTFNTNGIHNSNTNPAHIVPPSNTLNNIALLSF